MRQELPPTRKNVHHPYLDKIFEVSDSYLRKSLTADQLKHLKRLAKVVIRGNKRETITQWIDLYYGEIKRLYQAQHQSDEILDHSFHSSSDTAKVVWGDCLEVLRRMKSESVGLMVTSPPYYNARDYSQWPTLEAYLADMKAIILEAFRVLDNHRPFVFNVGDIFDNDRAYTSSLWGKRRIPLGAYFTQIFEDVGFQFVDDFIWDKGEVQSQRHKNGNNPYPLYQYPVNCYEHIFVFYKHRLDPTLYPCPVCGCLKVNGNAYSSIGVKSWECKNLECMERSEGNRGKRFSARTHVMNSLKQDQNQLNDELLDQWRRDIVKIPPVIKINSKGENTLGHTAPFPFEIPRYAISVFSGKGETVLDPFAGSFTTVIEALIQGRNGVGIEVNRSFFRSSVYQHFQSHGIFDSEILEVSA